MDKALRNTLRTAVTQCRRLLEEAVAEGLQGQFGIYVDRKGKRVIEPAERMGHLSNEDQEYRDHLLVHLHHIEAAGLQPKEAYDQLVREIAFTHLNRLCAYKMMEARGLIRESVSRGLKSQGFFFYLADHPEDEKLHNAGKQDVAYRNFLNWLGGTLSEEIGVLFNPNDPANRIYPPQRVLDEVLDLINDGALSGIWSQDETIGWVYQYFTPKELRDRARKESQAPRNSYELAFRNQFYTPRYVVEFLTDNTLGRIWYEMRKGETALKDRCRYLVRRPGEIFLAEGEEPPAEAKDTRDNLSQEELLKQPLYIPHRPKKDPREIKILDPACGSGHFLLYCFDLLQVIYEEAWEEQYAVGSRLYAGKEGADNERQELSGLDSLAESDGPRSDDLRGHEGFSQRGDVRADQPDSPSGGLDSIEHRGRSGTDFKQGVSELSLDSPRLRAGSGNPDSHRANDSLSPEREGGSSSESGGRSRTIDQRALELALKEIGYDYTDSAYCPLPTAYSSLDDLRRAVPGLILKHNLHGIDIDPRAVQIAALALWLRAQNTWRRLGLKPVERPRVTKSNIVTAEPMPGERDMRREFIDGLRPSLLGELVEVVFDKMKLAGEAGSLLRIEEEIRAAIRERYGKWGGMFGEQDEERWQEAEEHILAALEEYAKLAENGPVLRRRLFAQDAARGFAFVDLCRKRYDVVLMNPPFGEASKLSKEYIEKAYRRTKNDVYAAFVERGLRFLEPRGMLGAITSRTGFFLSSFRKWREEILLKEARPTVFADLGYGVLDTAMVETAAYCVEAMQ